MTGRTNTIVLSSHVIPNISGQEMTCAASLLLHDTAAAACGSRCSQRGHHGHELQASWRRRMVFCTNNEFDQVLCIKKYILIKIDAYSAVPWYFIQHYWFWNKICLKIKEASFDMYSIYSMCLALFSSDKQQQEQQHIDTRSRQWKWLHPRISW